MGSGAGAGSGSDGRNSRVVLMLLIVAQPVLFRPWLTVLNFTVASTGALLIAVTFQRVATLGIGGT